MTKCSPGEFGGSTIGSPLPGKNSHSCSFAKSGDRDAPHVEVVQHLDDRVELPLAAVDQQQIRFFVEALALAGLRFDRGRRGVALGQRWTVRVFAQITQPAPQRLLHRREIVRPFDGLDVEVPIVALLRPAFDEHDHRGDRIRSLDVRDVVALDPVRRVGQVERRRELGERRGRRGFGRLLMDQERAQVLLGVLLHQLQVVDAVTALGLQNANALALHLGQPRFDDAGVVGMRFDQDFLWDGRFEAGAAPRAGFLCDRRLLIARRAQCQR